MRKNYVWKIKNITNGPIHINDLGSNGLFMLAGEEINLHDRYNINTVENSEKLKGAINGDPPLVKEIIPFQKLDGTQVITPKSIDIIEVKKELTELKAMLTDLKPAIQIASVPVPPPAPAFDMDLLKDIIKEIKIQVVGPQAQETQIEGYSEKRPEDMVTSTLLSQKIISDDTKSKISSKSIKQTIAKSDTNIDDLTNLLENI